MDMIAHGRKQFGLPGAVALNSHAVRLRKLQTRAHQVEGATYISFVRQGFEVVSLYFIKVKNLTDFLFYFIKCGVLAFELVNGLFEVVRRR